MAFKRTLGSLGRLKQTAPPSLLSDVKQQIYKRSHGRFFAPRWKLFGRIPFEWISLGTIIAMLVYYLAVLHGSPAASTARRNTAFGSTPLGSTGGGGGRVPPRPRS